jgi:hypothetical protein
MRRFIRFGMVAIAVTVVIWLIWPALMPYAGPKAGPEGQVSRALLGERWPLSVDEGAFECHQFSIVFRAPSGQLYAVDAIARRRMPTMPEWKDVSEITLPGMNVQSIIEVGQAFCNY